MRNLYTELPTTLPEELIERLVDTGGVRIERIVSYGHTSPAGFWYDQAEHEWVVVLKGEATLRYDDGKKPIRLTPGDFVEIPPHRKHRVEWTTPNEPTIWLAVFFQP